MSETLTTSVTAALSANLLGSGNTGAVFANPAYALSLPTFLSGAFASGTGINKANQLYAVQFTLAAAANTVVDLYAFAAALDPLGNAYTQAYIKLLAIQIQGNAQYYATTVAVAGASGGTAYQVGDLLSPLGGTYSTRAVYQVATLSGSAIATVAIVTPGIYSVAPSLTNNAVVGGSGSGGQLTLTMPSAILSAAQIPTLSIFTESDFLTIGANGSNPWTAMFGGTTPTLKLYSGTNANPGTLILTQGGATSYPVTNSSNQNLKFVNSGANPVTFNLIVVGST